MRKKLSAFDKAIKLLCPCLDWFLAMIQHKVENIA